MFENADNYFADIFRGNLPYYLLISLPILIMCSSNPVLGANEFTIQRMSQFDVHGVPYGRSISMFSRLPHSSDTHSRSFAVTKYKGLFKSNYICSLVYIRSAFKWLFRLYGPISCRF